MEILRRCALLCVLALNACGFTRDDTVLEVDLVVPVVHSVLREGEREVQLMLRRVDSKEDPFAGGFERGALLGAHVTLSGPQPTATLQERQAGCVEPALRASPPEQQQTVPGCYSAVLSRGPRPGETYELDIEHADGTDMHGEATIVAPGEILEPAPGQVFETSPMFYDPYSRAGEIPVRFRAGPDARAYQVRISRFTAYKDGQPVPGTECNGFSETQSAVTVGDRVLLDVRALNCYSRVGGQPTAVEYDEIRAAVQLTVFDAAYARYLRVLGATKVNYTDAAAGVTGGLGVFASAASSEVEVRLLTR